MKIQHKFAVGQAVDLWPNSLDRHVPAGRYTVQRQFAERNAGYAISACGMSPTAMSASSWKASFTSLRNGSRFPLEIPPKMWVRGR